MLRFDGKRLRHALETSGRTEREVCKSARISRLLWRSYVGGVLHPSVPTLLRLCDALGISPNDLVR